MVISYGMSDKVGHMAFKKKEIKDLSPETRSTIEQETRHLIEVWELREFQLKRWQNSFSRAKKILQENDKQLHLLANALLEYETLSKEEIDMVVSGQDFKTWKLKKNVEDEQLLAVKDQQLRRPTTPELSNQPAEPQIVVEVKWRVEATWAVATTDQIPWASGFTQSVHNAQGWRCGYLFFLERQKILLSENLNARQPSNYVGRCFWHKRNPPRFSTRWISANHLQISRSNRIQFNSRIFQISRPCFRKTLLLEQGDLRMRVEGCHGLFLGSWSLRAFQYSGLFGHWINLVQSIFKSKRFEKWFMHLRGMNHFNN